MQKILSLQGTAAANGPYVNGLMVDGKVLPIPGDTAWSTGKFNHMPIMNGSGRGRGRVHRKHRRTVLRADVRPSNMSISSRRTYGGPAGPGAGPPNYPDGTPDAVLAKYPLSAYPKPGRRLDRGRHGRECLPASLSQQPRVAVCVRCTPMNSPTATRPGISRHSTFAHGAAHTIDIQFLFPDWHGGPLGILHKLSAQEHALSGQLVAAWTNFMYAGNPNLKGDPPWPRYTQDRRSTCRRMCQHSSTITAAQFAAAHKCAFWDTVLIY